MLRITSAQLNLTVGDIEGNVARMAQAARQALALGSHLVVFPELSVTGYYPADLLEEPEFLERVQTGLETLKVHSLSTPGLVWAVGLPMPHDGRGKRLHNALALLRDGEVLETYAKQLLPTYNVFDERRHFEPGPDVACVHDIAGHRVGFLICEDGWNVGETDYEVDPFARLAGSAELVVSLNASPSNIGKREQRHVVLGRAVNVHALPVLYVNQVGGHDQLVYDGASFAIEPGRVPVFEAKRFEEDVFTLDFNGEHFRRIDGERLVPVTRAGLPTMEFYRRQIVLGLRDYARRCGFTKVVVGSSGGIDSALTLALAVEALGAENVVAITMPSRFSSAGSVDDSVALCANLGIPLLTHPIKAIVDQYAAEFEAATGEPPRGLTLENLQARVRGTILMEYSNAHGHLLLTTGNKSEISVGYCVAGDHLVQTDQGLYSARELYAKLDNTGHTIRGKLVQAGAKREHSEYLKLTTQWGHELRVSPEHQMRVVNTRTGTSSFKAAKDVSAGDFLVLSAPFRSIGEPTLAPFAYEKAAYDFKSEPLLLPKTMTKELAKVLGICVADGVYCGKGLYRIITSKSEVADYLLTTLPRLGVCNASLEQRPRGAKAVVVASVEFCAFLKHLGVRQGAHNKQLPDAVLKSSSECWASFIEGLLLDATTNGKKNTSELTYHSVSRDLAYGVFVMLNALGIRSYFRVKTSLFEVYVPSRQAEKLAGVLKPSLSSRAKSNAFNRKKHRGSFDVLFCSTEELQALNKKVDEVNRQPIRAALREGNTWLSRNYLSQLADRYGADVSEVVSQAVCGMGSAKVTSITLVQETLEMFDFQVEGSEEFDIDGVTVHNCTLYGDTNGGLGLIGDLYKTEVFELSRHVNASAGREVIPVAIIDKAPSAELAPDQKDTDSLPPYEVLDDVLKVLIEGRRLAPEELWAANTRMAELRKTEEGRALITRVRGMIARNEYKRRQAPPILRLRARAFGSGRQMPIAAKVA